MKFLVTKELRHNPLLKKLVLFVTVILMLFLVSDMVLHHMQIGLTPDIATQTILGDEEAFIDPILFDMLLERVHIDILISLLSLLLISSVYISISKQQKRKGFFIHTAFITAILSHVALLLSYSYGIFFIMIWIGLFIAWHLLALIMSAKILLNLVRK